MNNNASQLMIGWTTCDDEATARNLAAEAVKRKLAACVQISAPVESHYVWDGKVTADKECSLKFKFPAHQAEALKAWLIQAHPYACPQWYAITAEDVHQPYLDWVNLST